MFLVLRISAQIHPPAPVLPVPSPAQLEWHAMETNAFIHFTINTFTNKEWGYGDEDPALFNPTNLNAEQWIRTLKVSGFKGVILTAKHHDGFCLWPSKYSNHTIAQSPYKNGKGDLVKEVSDACRKYGLKFGIYLSPWDRNRSDYGTPSYIDYYRNQLTELFTNYGPVFEMWFDGANGGDGYYGGAREQRKINGATYYNWPQTLELVRNMQPNVIFFSDAGPGVRWVGNENGEAGTTNWNTINPDTIYAGKPGIENLLQTGSPDGTAWIPAEVDVSIRPGWFYHKSEDAQVKSAEKLFDIYINSVGRGSTLLLNIAPDQRGLIPEKDISMLKEWKAMRDKAFALNLAPTATITTNSNRNNSAVYGAKTLTDGDPSTYWVAFNEAYVGVIDLKLDKEYSLNYLLLQEEIKLGQRVTKFLVHAYVNNGWRLIGQNTTIGYKRILDMKAIKTDQLRITFPAPNHGLMISNLELY